MEKLCECGCQLPAPIAKRTRPHLGHVQGEPVRFIQGHNGRKPRPEAAPCACGCGELATPGSRFIVGHNLLTPESKARAARSHSKFRGRGCRFWIGTAEERLRAKLGPPDPESGCIPFLGHRDHLGYGRLNDDQGRNVLAHRLAFELAWGPLSPGLIVHHVCENPSCVAIPHLLAISRKQHGAIHSMLRRVRRDENASAAA